MERDSFLDTNVIFNYSNYTDFSNQLIKKCYLFISNKTGKFILCLAVLNELDEIIKKRARIHKEVLQKIHDNSYSLDASLSISKKDIPFAKQLYEKLKLKSVNEAEKIFQLERSVSELSIDKFLQLNVDEKVIPLYQIDNELTNKIHEIISNHADCKILASAIQVQKDRPLFLFVTADGKDLNPNGYNYLKEHFKINYSKEHFKFPDLLNLMFSD